MVQNICSRWHQDITQDVTMILDSEITSEDIHKVKSIGWLVFDEAQRLDLLAESNTLIRAFLGKTHNYVLSMCYAYLFSIARGKHHAAIEVFEIIPSDARESVIAQWQDQVSDAYPVTALP